jgi:hypothetical protein
MARPYAPAAALLLLGVAPFAPASAQAVRTLAKPEFEYAEPFSQISGLRELKDGRVLVADTREKLLQAIDLRAGRVTAVGREGSGPNEWQLPMRLLPYPGDSVLVADPLNSRFLLVSPQGRPVRTIMPAAGPQPAARGPGGGAVMIGGIGLVSARAVDRQGRLYTTGLPIMMTPEGPKTADSVPILRQSLTGAAADTMAWLRLPKDAAQVSASSSGQQQTMSIRIGGTTPFVNGDEWAVAPDGRIVIARVADYHVDVVMPDKRVIRGAPVRYTPVRVTEADKQEWREARRNTQAVMMTNNNGVMSRQATTPPAEEPPAWPAAKSPFGSNSVFVAPNGQTWVLRQRAAGDLVPTFDVFDAQGRATGQVKLPPKTRLLAFGAKGVYLARSDDDDLQYIQHHVMSW